MTYRTSPQRVVAAVIVCAIACFLLVLAEFVVLHSGMVDVVTSSVMLFELPLSVAIPHAIGLVIGFGALVTFYAAGRLDLVSAIIAGSLSMFAGSRVLPISNMMFYYYEGALGWGPLVGPAAAAVTYLAKGGILAALGWRIADRSQVVASQP